MNQYARPGPTSTHRPAEPRRSPTECCRRQWTTNACKEAVRTAAKLARVPFRAHSIGPLPCHYYFCLCALPSSAIRRRWSVVVNATAACASSISIRRNCFQNRKQRAGWKTKLNRDAERKNGLRSFPLNWKEEGKKTKENEGTLRNTRCRVRNHGREVGRLEDRLKDIVVR